SSVTDPVTAATRHSVSASGTTEVGATVQVSVTDGSNTTAPAAATVDAAGNWTVTGIDVSALADGPLTYTAVATLAGATATATRTATKNTAAHVSITTFTNPVIIANQTTASVSGTTDVGDTVSVAATDGTNTTTVLATVDGAGNWTAGPIDLHGLA